MEPKGNSPSEAKATKRKVEVEDEDEDEIKPVGPSKQARTIGPSLPPQRSKADSDNRANGDSSEGESSDDDGFGPRLPSSLKPGIGITADPSKESISTGSYKITSASLSPVPLDKESAVNRNWMTVSPEDEQHAGGRQAPQKLKARGFQTGRAARTSTADAGGGGVGQQWTETVEEKRIRLENEIMGIKPNPSSTELGASSSPRDAATLKSKKMTEERMREFNEKTTRESLYAAKRRDTKDPAKDDDPSARPFDKEKDIGGSRTITNSQHRQMLNQASNYSSRFTKGSFL
jgi:hypothetical protein